MPHQLWQPAHFQICAGANCQVSASHLCNQTGLGFDLVGVARAESTRETEFLREWLARGYAGEMGYIGRRVEEADIREGRPDRREEPLAGGGIGRHAIGRARVAALRRRHGASLSAVDRSGRAAVRWPR